MRALLFNQLTMRGTLRAADYEVGSKHRWPRAHAGGGADGRAKWARRARWRTRVGCYTPASERQMFHWSSLRRRLRGRAPDWRERLAPMLAAPAPRQWFRRQ